MVAVVMSQALATQGFINRGKEFQFRSLYNARLLKD